MNYECIVKDFMKQLNILINQCTDPQFLAFVASNYANGKFTNDDLSETKGYRNGLKVAREIMKKLINLAEELEEGENEET